MFSDNLREAIIGALMLSVKKMMSVILSLFLAIFSCSVLRWMKFLVAAVLVSGVVLLLARGLP